MLLVEELTPHIAEAVRELADDSEAMEAPRLAGEDDAAWPSY